MINELDLVVLKRDITESNLITGDIGTVIHKYNDTNFEIEFVTAEGSTVAVLSLSNNDIRAFDHREILHTRDISNIAA